MATIPWLAGLVFFCFLAMASVLFGDLDMPSSAFVIGLTRLAIAAVAIAALPSLGVGLCAASLRRRFGWSRGLLFVSGLVSGGLFALPPAAISLFLDDDLNAALIFVIVFPTLTALSALLAWQATLRRRGPAGTSASVAEAFS